MNSGSRSSRGPSHTRDYNPLTRMTLGQDQLERGRERSQRWWLKIQGKGLLNLIEDLIIVINRIVIMIVGRSLRRARDQVNPEDQEDQETHVNQEIQNDLEAQVKREIRVLAHVILGNQKDPIQRTPRRFLRRRHERIPDQDLRILRIQGRIVGTVRPK